ncbi:MAG TPA: DUF294 nucleotidyltransferase-like domain-containing protein [Pyrinomonadaceae bacterium]|nr:DUF294 nucleotidyltransferase-like domain-containing protein [Pyrinomonadaceae bacterium]HMP65211.1 DUF294 nucleotidyltransferase-like domain-containing protein [Pyrinomonadaceae bacterium]
MTDVGPLIKDLPDPESASRFFARLEEQYPSVAKRLVKNRPLLSDVLTLSAYSPLLAATMLQNPEYITWLGRKRAESTVRDKEELLESLARFSLTNSQVEPHILLSRFRRRELMRIFLRDIRRLATVTEITEELSNLADAILEHALRLARQELDNRYGQPLETDDKNRIRPAEICIVSLGKLGSRELNYASDIDLLFIYSDEGRTAGVGPREPLTNREYFIKLAEAVIKLVGEQTGEGAAYRVDLRLRPHGRVGPLALSLVDIERYYRGDAAVWERQVLIRSRASAGSEAICRRFFDAVESSVFSAELSVEEALRHVRESKQKIDLENINARGLNVKLGRGGIREIEFIAQALQLAHADRDRWLRVPHTLISIARLADRGMLTNNELTSLSDAYHFLRRAEHLLQMENGLQTHTVPNEERPRALLARRMGFSVVDQFDKELHIHTANVRGTFERVFGLTETSFAGANDRGVDGTFLEDPQESANGCGLPAYITELADEYPRLQTLLASLEGGLASEFPQRDYRSSLAEAIEGAANHRTILSRLRKAWRRCFAEIYFYDCAGKLSIARSKELQTELAEASISAALSIAVRQVEEKYVPSVSLPPMAILGLGKIGGAGVDHDSDLDLVIVYDGLDLTTGRQSDRGRATGPTSSELCSRVVEIFVNTLSAITREGSLYRVDLRLRPHGKDGPPAISRSAFLEYMRASSAIWEMLAFVKLRGVGGEAVLAREIEAEIRNTIHKKASKIPGAELAAETNRIRKELEKQRSPRHRSRDIDIKYGEGGMLDIYFAIRFLQLRDNVPDDDAHRSTGQTLRLLKENGSLEKDVFEKLFHGYEFLSSLDHYLRLTVGRTSRLPLANQNALTTIARRMGLASPTDLLENLSVHRLDIRSAFDLILSEDSHNTSS